MSQLSEKEISERLDTSLQDGPTIHTTKYETKVPSLHKLYILALSLIAGLLTVALPFLTDMANSIQSQNLYIGMMLSRGQIPYSDVFTTGGFLYFVLIALSYHLGTTLFLILIQMTCFYLTGLYLYKLINYVTAFQKVALAFSVLYYVFSLILGFGGMYPIQFAMPFVLISTWFLTKYFVNLVQDEAFILFGFFGAIAMLLEPRTLVFWLLACLTVISYNMKNGHLARGFYQLLAAIFGMILIFYTAGYFILNLQILSPYLTQAVGYPFTYFKVGSLELLAGMGMQLALAVGFGLLTGLVYFLKNSKESSDSFMKWLITLVLLTYLVIAMLAQDLHTYHLLPLLPFALILTSQPIAKSYQTVLNKVSHRRRRGKNGTRCVISLYLKKHLYLPLVLLVAALTCSVYRVVKESETNQVRGQIANYLKSELNKDQAIYVWDTSSKIYLETGAKSASQFPSPFVNLKKQSHQHILEDELLENEAVYIVVNNHEKLPRKI